VVGAATADVQGAAALPAKHDGSTPSGTRGGAATWEVLPGTAAAARSTPRYFLRQPAGTVCAVPPRSWPGELSAVQKASSLPADSDDHTQGHESGGNLVRSVGILPPGGGGTPLVL
jgi:hypothetical protein